MPNASPNRLLGAFTLPLIAVLCLVGQNAHAQGSAQVVMTGVPPSLSATLLVDIERDYEAGLFPLQFIYNDPTGGHAEFRFRVMIELEGRIVLDATSNGVRYAPGIYLYRSFRDAPAVSFPGGYAGFLDGLDPSVRDQIERSGRLPEGDYMVTIEAVPANANQLIVSVPGVAPFSVRYAEPPLLLTPVDHAIVTESLPMFSWSPATNLPPGATVEYDLRIVEIIPGQLPLQALEGNIPHVQTTLTGVTTFAYLQSELPLQYGAQYVWQVTAREGQVPFTNGGETEIFTFTYGDGSAGVVWRYPASDPFIEFTITDPVALSTGLRVDGHYTGTVAGEQMDATFENVVLHSVTHELLEGTVTLSSGVTIGAGE